MKRDRLSVYKYITIVGIIPWAAVIFLRGLDYDYNDFMKLMLGIAPNFCAAITLPFAALAYLPASLKNTRSKERSLFYIACIVIFIALFISEVVHDAFLGASFDTLDMMASGVAIALDIIIYEMRGLFNRTEYSKGM